MPNRMKEKIRQRQAALGLSLMIPSPQLVEMAGKIGFDWVLIDCEHGSIGLETVELMVMAAEACGITAIVRPPKNDPETVLQYLDRGVGGIQAPHVNTAAEAAQIVAAAKYHPEGARSLAVGTRSAGYGLRLDLDKYTSQANHELLVCVQIEDKEALGNIGEIAAVPGIDVLFVGPSDLSQSLGYPGQSGHPVVQEAINSAFAAIAATGRASGTAGNFAVAEQRLKQGVTYFYTHLTTVFAHGCNEFFRFTGGIQK
ncbi:MAG: aldolase/citrate lyase family protein [Negativicutes bacterium]|nr:aldolase/citrate lyase family protein [Negativicutes bacterium]